MTNFAVCLVEKQENIRSTAGYTTSLERWHSTAEVLAFNQVALDHVRQLWPFFLLCRSCRFLYCARAPGRAQMRQTNSTSVFSCRAPVLRRSTSSLPRSSSFLASLSPLLRSTAELHRANSRNSPGFDSASVFTACFSYSLPVTRGWRTTRSCRDVASAFSSSSSSSASCASLHSSSIAFAGTAHLEQQAATTNRHSGRANHNTTPIALPPMLDQ